MDQESLSDAQRRALEDAVVSARKVSERGARAAVDELGVGEAQPYDHLTGSEKELRRRLRARARQLGDGRNSDGTHGTEHLVREIAYEHWHRMLFARFLAENDLLMHPDGVPLTLEECEELAETEDVTDGWELAGRYAARMLPQIFRPDAPALQVQLAPEYRQELEDLLEELNPEIFTARDALGWVYQYWQSKRKDQVNASEVKIGADELPAVTQLFTESYMVNFLLENSLGAWWESRHPEDDLPVEMPYLRRTEDGTPAAGDFDGWPDRAAELKVLDPCCGSGHFLVAVLHLLVPMRMQEEGLSAQEACDAVIADNLYGLEIDQRCTEIAAFAVALAAWTYPEAEGYRELPGMQIACSGLSIGASEQDWVGYGGDDERLKRGMRRLYQLFEDAPTLGSLIDPTQNNGDLFDARYEEVEPLLKEALKEEEPDDYQAHEIGVTAKGLAKAAQLLAGHYQLITTNVPYLAKGRQAKGLRDFTEEQFEHANNDIATSFMVRSLRAARPDGSISLVVPQSWLFQYAYSEFRKYLLRGTQWNVIAVLGARAFREISGEVVNVCLVNITASSPDSHSEFAGLDVSDGGGFVEKREMLRSEDPYWTNQRSQINNPEARVVLEALPDGKYLDEYASSYQGIKTGDDPRLRRYFWEVDIESSQWKRLQGSVSETKEFGGLDSAVDWEGEGEKLARKQGLGAWGKKGASVRQVGDLPASIYMGGAFDSNVSAIVPDDPSDAAAIWAFCSSEQYREQVRKIDRGLAASNAAMAQIPVDIDKWRKLAERRFSDGLPEAHSEDPTQWIFDGSIASTGYPLQVAVARLVGYKWPEQGEDVISDLVDEDGIVCIPSVRGEQPGESRLQEVLACAYGEEWSVSKTDSLLSEVGYGGGTLKEWLREGFFEQHCGLFENRPFIWHVWDGRHDGFGALVNYHTLDRATLERLTYTYLGDWIHRQKKEVEQDRDAAEARLHAAQDLQQRLELILEGEKPYDIFVRWKPLEEQPIGWNPDVDDGVRQNIRPFVKANVLRKTPNIKWTNDRGKKREGEPWYKEFDGKRVNDYHLALEEKKQASRKTA